MPIDPQTRAAAIDALFEQSRIVPVIHITQLEDAIPLAQALVKGGLNILEITLRSDVAVESIAAIHQHVEGAIVGAGTVLNRAQYEAVIAAGAQFVISPGASPELYDTAGDAQVPWIPGVATASDIMLGLQRGYSRFKFFPAIAAGGLSMLQAWKAPFPGVKFCPTGGITAATAGDFLTQSNVMGIGGSWMLKKDILESAAWDQLEILARDAASI